MYVLAHMTGLISFNTQARMYAYTLPGHIDQELYPDDLTRPAIYITSVKISKNEAGCRDDTMPKTVDTRRHCEED